MKKRTLFVLLATTVVLSLGAQAQEDDLYMDDDFEIDEVTRNPVERDIEEMEEESKPSRYAKGSAGPEREADRRQAELAANAIASPSLAEQIANVAAFMPLADSFKLRTRILKLGAFCDHLQVWLNSEVGVKPPADKAVLCLIFVLSSYLPALLATVIYAGTCKKHTPPRFDPSTYTFNKPDAAEIAKILQTVAKIQQSVA